MILVQEVDSVATAKPQVDGIDVIWKRRDDRAEVLGAQRYPEAFGNLAACLAVIQGKAEDLRVDKGIVLADSCDRLVSLFVVHVGTQAPRPLRPVCIEAEEVFGRVHVRRFLGAGRAVDKGRRRLSLGVVTDCDPFRPRKRAYDHGKTILFHKLACGANGTVRRCVGGLNDKFHVLAGNFAAKGRQRSLHSANAIFAKHSVSAFQCRHRANLECVLVRMSAVHGY